MLEFLGVDCWVVEFRELGEGLNRGRNVEGEVRFSFLRVGFFRSSLFDETETETETETSSLKGLRRQRPPCRREIFLGRPVLRLRGVVPCGCVYGKKRCARKKSSPMWQRNALLHPLWGDRGLLTGLSLR